MSLNRTLAIISLVFLSLGFASMGVASRWMAEGFGNMSQVSLRILGAFILTSIFFYRDISWKKILGANPKTWLVLLAVGILGYAGMVYTITVGALTTKLLHVAVLYSTVPFFVYLGSLLISREKPRLIVVVLLLASIWGVGSLTSGSLLPSLTGFGKGEFYVLVSAAFDAVYFLGLKGLQDRLNSREIAATTLLIGGLSAAVLSFYLGETIDFSVLSNWHVSGALAFGILQNIWVPLLTMYAFKYINEVVATQFFLLENFFALAFGYFLYQESANLTQLIGAAIIVTSVYFMNKVQTT